MELLQGMLPLIFQEIHSNCSPHVHQMSILRPFQLAVHTVWRGEFDFEFKIAKYFGRPYLLKDQTFFQHNLKTRCIASEYAPEIIERATIFKSNETFGDDNRVNILRRCDRTTHLFWRVQKNLRNGQMRCLDGVV